MVNITFIKDFKTYYSKSLYSPIQGLTFIDIHNNLNQKLEIYMYDSKYIVINPHDQYRYRGKYGYGISIGEYIKTSIGNIYIDKEITSVIVS
jgi:hypothetical protein